MKNYFYKWEINLKITFNHFIKFKPLYLKKISNFFSLHIILQSPIFEDLKNILVQNPFLASHWDLNYLKLIASLQEFYSMACKLNSPAWHLCFIYVNSTGLLQIHDIDNTGCLKDWYCYWNKYTKWDRK